jgi:hypothetical protein
VNRDLPAVSIGLPVRNGAPLLAAAIESLLAQDFGDFELLISDNASDDGTPDLCSTFARSDRRVRTIDSVGARSRQSFPSDVSDRDPRRRLRWIWRGGGWAAIYGLIRREVLGRTRTLTEVARLPRWLRYPDCLVVELSLLGPFARRGAAAGLQSENGRAPLRARRSPRRALEASL